MGVVAAAAAGIVVLSLLRDVGRWLMQFHGSVGPDTEAARGGDRDDGSRTDGDEGGSCSQARVTVRRRESHPVLPRPVLPDAHQRTTADTSAL